MSMSRRNLYKLHKWFALTVGVFLVTWLVSGIVMVLPELFETPTAPPPPAFLDMQEVRVTPREAVARLQQDLGETPRVLQMVLKRIVQTPVYQIAVVQRGSYLIDARSGQPFVITAETAVPIARAHAGTQAPVVENDYLTRRTFAYPWGPLPVYRIVFADHPKASYYVFTRNGTVQRSDPWSQFQNVIASLHTFHPLDLVTGWDGVRKGVLVVLGVIGIGAAATGYYLAIPRRRSRTI